MFKHFLIIIILILVTLTVTYFLLKNILISTHKLYLHSSKIKYTLHDTDSDFLKKYSNIIDIFDIKNITNIVIYTNIKWSTKNNNYLKFKERYYIIEPGYYYYIIPEIELFLNNNCKINYFKIKNTGSF